MFGIGGFNPVSLLATAALGPMGGIVAQLATQVLSQVGQQLIQNLGQNLGLPQSSIDLAQGAFAASHGDFQGGAANLDEALDAFGQGTGATPWQTAEAQREFGDAINDFVSSLSEGEDFKAAKSSGGGGGWLMAMATVLGKKLNEMAADMEDMAGQISKDTPDLTAKFGALSQQFSIMMNATTTAIKTVGEAMANTARKQ